MMKIGKGGMEGKMKGAKITMVRMSTSSQLLCWWALPELQRAQGHVQRPLVPSKLRARLGCSSLQQLVGKSCLALATEWVWHPWLKCIELILHKFRLQCAFRESPGLALGSKGKSNEEKEELKGKGELNWSEFSCYWSAFWCQGSHTLCGWVHACERGKEKR